MCVLALAITTPTPPFSRIALECYRKLALLAITATVPPHPEYHS